MLLTFLITCITCFFISKFFSLNPLFSWVSEMKLLPLSFRKVSSLFSFVSGVFGGVCSSMWSNGNGSVEKRMECVMEREETSIFDLPELVIECILEKLPPAELCTMASVCTSLREWCISDRLWEKHMNRKWGRIIGPAAYREWQWYIATRSWGDEEEKKQKGFWGYLTWLPPFLRIWSNVDDSRKVRNSMPVDSIMSWYLALQSGKFSFTAQVYNRENGHVGFMLSCYDAELSYDSCTDTFQARYPPHETRAVAVENYVSWKRLRGPPVETSPHDLHVSDCLNELRPGDHVEIQWRRNKEFPYGWWYGIVGHLELCDGNENYCCCHNSDMVALEFNQYHIGSRWRRAIIDRKDHREEGNETDGFYAGVRKLHSHEEISTWKRLWPTEVLE